MYSFFNRVITVWISESTHNQQSVVSAFYDYKIRVFKIFFSKSQKALDTSLLSDFRRRMINRHRHSKGLKKAVPCWFQRADISIACKFYLQIHQSKNSESYKLFLTHSRNICRKYQQKSFYTHIANNYIKYQKWFCSLNNKLQASITNPNQDFKEIFIKNGILDCNIIVFCFCGKY